MDVMDTFEETADSVAELAVGAVALLDDTVSDSRGKGSLLLKILIIAVLIGVIAGAVAKMRGGDQPTPAQPA